MILTVITLVLIGIQVWILIKTQKQLKELKKVDNDVSVERVVVYTEKGQEYFEKLNYSYGSILFGPHEFPYTLKTCKQDDLSFYKYEYKKILLETKDGRKHIMIGSFVSFNELEDGVGTAVLSDDATGLYRTFNIDDIDKVKEERLGFSNYLIKGVYDKINAEKL